MPFDLSNVLFIATANEIQNIKPALLDRLEVQIIKKVIELSGYTVTEKIEIAKKYIIPKQIIETGINQFKIDNQLIEFIIKGYAREPGVR